MSLFDYYAIQTALRLSKDAPRKWKVTEAGIKAIETVFEPCLDDDKLVLTPRFNGSYISFRYCGLEVLQLSRKGKWSKCVKLEEGQVKRAGKLEKVASIVDLDIQCFVKDIRNFLEEYLHCFPEAINTRRHERLVPGFSLEHWMESIVLADTLTGRKVRKYLGLSQDLQMVVSQVPVIVNRSRIKMRACHIDLLSINEDGRIIVVELKKDDDLDKAKDELEQYTNWLLLRNRGEFCSDRGNPAAMVKENYLPGDAKTFVGLSPARVDAVAVVVSKGGNDTVRRKCASLGNGVPFTIIELPENWLSGKGSIFSV